VHVGVPTVLPPVAAAGRGGLLLLSPEMAMANMTDPDAGVTTPPDHFPLTRHELALIVAFWALYALLTVANRLFDPSRFGPPLTLTSGPVLVAFVDSLCWTLLTPPLFWLAGRAGTDRTPRAVQLALFVAVGVATAALLTLIGNATRTATFGPPPDEPRPRHGPPLWFAFLNALVIYLGVLAAGLARAYSLRYRARREQAARLQAQLAQAHLDALRRQLDPHFLFNTLHAVSSLVERDPRGVRRMISRLSDLLRHSIEGANEPELPLRDELELLGRYLDIMQVRFQGRLEVETRADERALDALVPNLILQPLVENAIKHGVEKLTGPGRIVIEADVEGGIVVLRVRDNGPDAGRASSGTAGSGVGLRNTVARLEQLYGAAQRFTLGPGEDGGTVAEVRLPYRTSADARAAAPATTDRAVVRVG
jgi:two-component system, LytTR family, sensor kinase